MSNNDYSSFDYMVLSNQVMSTPHTLNTPVTSSDTSLKKATSKYNILDVSSPIPSSVPEGSLSYSALEVDVLAGLLSNQSTILLKLYKE